MDDVALSLLRAMRPKDSLIVHLLRATPGTSLDASLRDGGFVGLDQRSLRVNLALGGPDGEISVAFDDVLYVDRRRDGVHIAILVR